ncbi:MAG: hypothetical protein LBF27_25775 [Sphingobacterium sp.]|jgi:hypothetical protein|nr:hypothetical protein [Sphingobacterium sp.]
MNVVIKNQRDKSTTGEKLRRDALVSDGTLMLLDFSNGGTTFEYNLSKGIYDLARDAAFDLDVETNPVLKSKTVIPDLTAGKGLPGISLGATTVTDYTAGLLIEDVSEYLYLKQPHALLFFWVRIDLSRPNIASSYIAKSQDGGTAGNISIQAPSSVNPYVSVRFADKITAANLNIGSTYAQIGAEFINGTTANKLYVNGVFSANGTTVNGGFLQPTGDKLVALGARGAAGVACPLNLYRIGIEDLDISGRTASEVMRKDWEYCTQTGEYLNKPTKRPFIDVA